MIVGLDEYSPLEQFVRSLFHERSNRGLQAEIQELQHPVKQWNLNIDRIIGGIVSWPAYILAILFIGCSCSLRLL